MKASEIILENLNWAFSLYYSKFVYGGGLNINRAKSGYSIWNLVLNKKDVEILESWFATQGIEGDYKYTKAHTWVRCQNQLDKKQMVDLTKYLRTNKIKFGK